MPGLVILQRLVKSLYLALIANYMIVAHTYTVHVCLSPNLFFNIEKFHFYLFVFMYNVHAHVHDNEI